MCYVAGGHLGRDKTHSKISPRYYWPNMYTDIEEYVKTCETCQRANIKNTEGVADLHPIPVTKGEAWYSVNENCLNYYVFNGIMIRY